MTCPASSVCPIVCLLTFYILKCIQTTGPNSTNWEQSSMGDWLSSLFIEGTHATNFGVDDEEIMKTGWGGFTFKKKNLMK